MALIPVQSPSLIGGHASFRGALFRIDVGTRAAGRRSILYEFPKRDQPASEDMGRRAKRWTLQGWTIGPNYATEADRLETALNSEGPGTLIHPTLGSQSVCVEGYHRAENRQEGRMARFDMSFFEAGSATTDLVGQVAQALSQPALQAGAEIIKTSLTKRLLSV
jgi:prophage DNA circulation protein